MTCCKDLYEENISEELPKIACKKIRPDEDAFLPAKREEDSDYDLFASQDTLCCAGAVTMVSTNLAIEYPEGFEGKIEDKGGLGAKGMTVFGGVMDNGYIGEHLIGIYNAGKSNYLFRVGHKVAQLHLRKKEAHRTFWFVTRDLRKSERGDGKWGSTGA